MQISGLDYPAEAIEHAFNRLFNTPTGQRGMDWDADVFRDGTPAQLGMLLVKTADHLESNFGSMAFSEEDKQNGGHKAIVSVSVSRIRELGNHLQSEPETNAEANDYHWILVGELIDIVAVLLERANQP